MKQKEKKSSGSRFRFIDLLIVVLCLSLTVYSIKVFRDDLYQTMSLQNIQHVGTITIKNNIVQRRLFNRVIWDRLRVESPVYLGDIIRVADQSEAMLNIEDQHIDIGENTLIRILLSPDGSGALQIELTEGNLSFSNLGNENSGLQLNIMGRVIETKAGTVLSAAAGKDGMSLQVTEGSAVFIDDEKSREIQAGAIVALDSEGVEQRLPAAVVLRPKANARYVKNSSAPLPVHFEWNRINLRPQDTLHLEIAADRNFSRDVQSFANLSSTADASLAAGNWNWRLLQENTVLSSGKLTVVEAVNFSLLSPARGSVFRYSDDAPSLRFQWSEIEEASHYVIEISSSQIFAYPRISREIAAPFFVDSTLAEGTWYWRVQPVFPSDVYEGGASFSSASFFRLEKTEQIAAEEQAVVFFEGEQLREVERTLVSESEPVAAATPVAAFAETPPPAPRPAPQRQTPAPRPAPSSPPRQTSAPAAAITPAVSAQPLLSPPANKQPANGQVIGIEQLKTRRNIVFTWAAVEGANAYIFTLYEQGAERRQIAGVITTDPTWTLENIDILGRGTFVWHVEAVSRNADGVIAHHGVLGENTFTMDIPQPRPVQMEAPGVLYGF